MTAPAPDEDAAHRGRHGQTPRRSGGGPENTATRSATGVACLTTLWPPTRPPTAGPADEAFLAQTRAAGAGPSAAVRDLVDEVYGRSPTRGLWSPASTCCSARADT